MPREPPHRVLWGFFFAARFVSIGYLPYTCGMENTDTRPLTYEELPQEYIDLVFRMGSWTEEYTTRQLLEFNMQLGIATEHYTMTYNEEAWGHWAMDRIRNLNLDAMNKCILDLAQLVALRVTLNYEPTIPVKEEA